MTMKPKTHDLKTWPEFFVDVDSGQKDFEVRVNDRGYAVGDTLNLREFDPALGKYTGRACRRWVRYVMPGGKFGLAADYCVMGLGYMTDHGAPNACSEPGCSEVDCQNLDRRGGWWCNVHSDGPLPPPVVNVVNVVTGHASSPFLREEYCGYPFRLPSEAPGWRVRPRLGLEALADPDDAHVEPHSPESSLASALRRDPNLGPDRWPFIPRR